VRVLFDQETPVPLRQLLPGHEVSTAYERGWSTLKNGELLSAAEVQGFHVLVTTDQNLRYQQNLASRSMRDPRARDDELAAHPRRGGSRCGRHCCGRPWIVRGDFHPVSRGARPLSAILRACIRESCSR